MPILPVKPSQKAFSEAPTRRSVKAPNAGDIQSISPARDPGLNVPLGAFEGIGSAIGELAPGFESIALKIKAREDKLASAQRTVDLSNAQAEAERRYFELQSDLEKDTDYRTHGDRFRENAENISMEIAANLEDEKTRMAFQAWNATRSVSFEHKVRSSADTSRINQGKSDIEKNMGKLSELMATAQTPEEKMEYETRMRQLMMGSTGTFFTGPDAEKELDKNLRRSNLLELNDIIQANPELAKRQLKEGRFEFLTAEDVDKAEKSIATAVDAIETDRRKAESDAEKAEKKRIVELQNDYFLRSQTEEGVTAKEILASDLPAFGKGSKKAFLKIIEEQNNGLINYNKTNSKVFNDFMERILLPDGSPEKITDRTDIYESVGRGLKREDGDWLINLIDNLQKPDSEEKRTLDQQKEFFKTIKGVIQGATMFGASDPRGGEHYYRFMFDVRALHDRLVKDGKDPSILYNPNSKEYVGSKEFLKKYQRTQLEIMRDQAEDLRVIDETIVEKRKPGETPEEYLRRTGKIQ